MPFDAGQIDKVDVIALYRERRENAAALWRSVPKHDFVMSDWHCGSSACALGWLAVKQVDGWRFSGPNNRPCIGYYDDPEDSAALYFGLSYDDAFELFYMFSADANTVASLLMQLPYVRHESAKPE